MAGRVAVVFGGPSAEAAISVLSAQTVIPSLRQAGLLALPVFIHEDGPWSFGSWGTALPTGEETLSELRELIRARGDLAGEGARRLQQEVDVVFPCLHGQLGEDGAIQGLAQVLGLPCVGPDLFACALALDKERCKDVLCRRTPVLCAPSRAISRSEWEEDAAGASQRVAALLLPWIVKPAGSGSSVGLQRVDDPGQLPEALERAFAVRESYAAMVEEYVPGLEVTCLVIGNPETGLEALPPVLIEPLDGGLFDYQAKYTPGLTRETCPAPLEESLLERIREQAALAYQAIRCRGLARVDFILRGEDPVFLEINTLPGFTSESLAPKAARAAGYSLPRFFARLVELALEGRRSPKAAVA